MASAQCQPPTEHQHHSLGQNVSEMAGRLMKRESHHGNTDQQAQIQSYTHTESSFYSEDGVVAKTQMTECSTQKTNKHGQAHCGYQAQSHASNGTATCTGRTKKKSLMEKIKDGLSRRSDKDGGSSSSSDSESDNEKCEMRKN